LQVLDDVCRLGTDEAALWPLIDAFPIEQLLLSVFTRVARGDECSRQRLWRDLRDPMKSQTPLLDAQGHEGLVATFPTAHDAGLLDPTFLGV